MLSRLPRCLLLFSQFIKDLSVPRETRVKAMSEVFSDAGFTDVNKNFLAVLADNGRAWNIERIAQRFVDLTMAHRGEVKVIVTTVIVMRSMALMDPEELMSYMTVKLPMSEIRGKMAASSLEEMDLLESIILSTMEGIEELALEGLKIQMESSGRIGEAGPLGRTGDAGKETFVLVMRIKMKDPEAEYDTVGDEMLGFLEVPCDAEGLRNHRVQAVHVAGIRRGGGGGWFMWSASLVESKGLQSQCSFEYIRNQDIAFTHAGK